MNVHSQLKLVARQTKIVLGARIDTKDHINKSHNLLSERLSYYLFIVEANIIKHECEAILDTELS